MGSPYLSRNESMILTAHRIWFKSVMNDVILTNQRMILVDTDNPRFRPETIPLTTIETVLARESGAGYPEITLSVTAPQGGGASIPVIIVFIQRPGESRVRERDEWVAVLKEQVALVRERVREAGGVPEYPSPGIGGESGEAAASGAATPEEHVPTVFPAGIPPGLPYKRSPLADRFHPVPLARKRRRSSRFVVVTVIIFIAVVLGGGYLVGTTFLKSGIPGGNQGAVITPSVPATVPVQTATVHTTTVPSPVSTESTILQETMTPPQPTTTNTPPAIPQRGVWVRVVYPGDFSGSVGISGRMNEILGSGTGLYQVPAQNEIVEAAIQKMDGSGRTLTVEIYNNGMIAGHDSTSSPEGSIDLHVSLKNG